MIRSDCVCVCRSVHICKVALREERGGKRAQRRGRRRGRRGLCGERDWQSPRLKQASRFYNQLRNVDMNRLLLFYTEQRWTTRSNYLYFTTFKACCSLLPLFSTSLQSYLQLCCPPCHLFTYVLLFFHNPASYKIHYILIWVSKYI